MTQKLDNDIKPVEQLIRTGVSQQFYKNFGVPVLFTNGTDGKKEAMEKLKKKGHPQYPFAIARTGNLAVTEGRYKPNTLLRKGLTGQASSDNLLAFRLRLLPVSTSYELLFYMQGWPEAERIGKQWLFAAVRRNMKFTIPYGVAALDISIDMDTQVNIPQRGGGLTEIKEYEIATNMIVHGYMAEQINTMQAVTEIDIEEQVLNELRATGGDVHFFKGKTWAENS